MLYASFYCFGFVFLFIQTKLTMSKFNLLTVKEIVQETPNAVSIVFDIPENLKNDYTFIAGQYITIKFQYQGQEIRRSYSLCSTPLSGEFRIVVKKVKDGVFSTHANEALKVGDTLEVGIPEGRFTLVPNAENINHYAAFAAGSGITPVISIVKTVLEQEPDSTFVLVYGNRSAEETIFYKEVHLLEESFPNRFFLHLVFSRERGDNALFGRIDKAATNFVIKNKHKDKQFAQFFICGPEDMIDTVSNTLEEKGIDKKAVAFEIFTPSNNDEVTLVGAVGRAKVTAIVDDVETSFEMSKDEVLLNAALKAGVDAPYSCQGGICSSCMCKIEKGSAIMKKNSILTDDEIEEGLILSCQAIVTSDEIIVNYDEM